MKPPDRMTLYEAPRPVTREREMRTVSLRCSGKTPGGSCQIVQIPANMPLPDLIRYRGHTYMRRCDDLYSEASMWPVVDELDAADRR